MEPNGWTARLVLTALAGCHDYDVSSGKPEADVGISSVPQSLYDHLGVGRGEMMARAPDLSGGWGADEYEEEPDADVRILTSEQLFKIYHAQRGELGDSGRAAVRRVLGSLKEAGLVERVSAGTDATNRYAVWRATTAGQERAVELLDEYHSRVTELQQQYGILRAENRGTVFGPLRDLKAELEPPWVYDEIALSSGTPRVDVTYDVDFPIPAVGWSQVPETTIEVRYEPETAEFRVGPPPYADLPDGLFTPSATAAAEYVRENLDALRVWVEKERLRRTIGHVDGVGDHALDALIAEFGTLEAVETASDTSADALTQADGIGPQTAALIHTVTERRE